MSAISPFTHTPSLPILLWVFFALPFTLWDSAYLFLRPNSLPNHQHHQYFAYAGTYTTWAKVDHSYGEKGWRDGDGFVSAQALVNVLVEVLGYGEYVWLVAGGDGRSLWTWDREKRRKVSGRRAAWAVLLGFAAGVVTATKTFLYFMREVLSGFRYTGHNDWWTFLMTWCGMNLLYTIASGAMVIMFGKDILNGLVAPAAPQSGIKSGNQLKSKRR